MGIVFFTKGMEVSKSPLSSSFESADSRKSSRKGWLGLSAVAFFGLASAGSVFAASVSINSGADISFTQGVETIAACDTDGIDAVLGTAYSASADAFSLNSIELTGINNACDAKTLTLSLWDASDAQMLEIEGTLEDADGVTNWKISHASAIVEVEAGDDVDSSPSNTWVGAEGDVIVDFLSSDTAVSMASDATDITIEIN